jgi:O-antigen ligase
MPAWAYVSVAVLVAAVMLGGTRSIWLAAVPAVLYLVWIWRPRMILAVPVLAALGFLVAPHNVKERLDSLVKPQENVDSNRFRVVTFRTGVEMIKAHPWLGLGPEEINRNFSLYVPKDIRRPLPPGYYGHLHNIYVQFAAERGIPGLLCVLWFIGLALYDCIRAILSQATVNTETEPRPKKAVARNFFSRSQTRGARSQELFFLHGMVAVTIAILVEGIFEYNLGDSEVLMMFVSVVALEYAAISSLNRTTTTVA